MKYFNFLSLLLTTIAAIITLIAKNHVSGWNDRITGGVLFFNLYLMLPYFILWWIISKSYRIDGSRANRISIFITTILITLLSLAVSWESIYDNGSSTSALVFLYIPIYCLLLIAFAYPVIRFIINYLEKNK